MLSVFFEEFWLGIRSSLLSVTVKENAVHFFGRILVCNSIFPTLGIKLGKMLSIVLNEFLSAISSSRLSESNKGSIFEWILLCNLILSAFNLKQGKMLSIFFKEFLFAIRCFLFLVSTKGRCCSFFLRIRGNLFWSLLFRCQRGKFCQIVQTILGCNLILSIVSLKQEKMLSVFQGIHVCKSIFSITGVNEGKMLFILFRESVANKFDLSFFFGVKQGKVLSIFMPFLLGNWSCLFLVYYKGDAVNFFKNRVCGDGVHFFGRILLVFNLFCFQCQFLKELLFAIRSLSIALHVFQVIRGTPFDIT